METTVGRKRDISDIIEDYALRRIPLEERKGWFSLFVVFAGFATAMVMFLFGGVTTTLAGFGWGITACLIAAIAAFVATMLLATIGLREGLSADLCSRAYGFGQRGSVLTSSVYAYFLILYLAVETAIIVGAASYIFGWDPNAFGTKLAVYVPLFGLWAILTLFGFGLLAQVALVATTGLLLLLIYSFFFILMPMGTLGGAFANPGLPGLPLNQGGLPQDVGFLLALNFMMGVIFQVSVFSADYSRYSRRVRDLWPMAAAGSFGAFFLVPVLGAIVVFAGFPQVFGFFKSIGLPDAAAGSATAGSPGMAFVIIAGALGLVLVFFSQVKIQTMNAYGASLAIVNFLSMGFKWKPGRGWAVIGACTLGAIMVFATNVTEMLMVVTPYLGIWVGTWGTIIITDYYIVRRGLKLGLPGIRNLENLPDFNWPGIATFVLTVAITSYLFAVGVVAVAVALAIPMAVVLHTAFSLVTQGKYQTEVEALKGDAT